MSITTNPPDPDAADPTAVIRRMFDEGFATGDGAVVDEICSPDLVEHQFGLSGDSAAAIQHVKDAMRQVHGAVPDISFTIEESVENGDKLWVRVRARYGDRPVLRSTQRAGDRLHRVRRRPRRGRPDRGALGSPGPLRHAGPDRSPGPPGVAVSGAGVRRSERGPGPGVRRCRPGRRRRSSSLGSSRSGSCRGTAGGRPRRNRNRPTGRSRW